MIRQDIKLFTDKIVHKTDHIKNVSRKYSAFTTLRLQAMYSHKNVIFQLVKQPSSR